MVKLGYTKYGKRKREGKGKRRGKAKVVNLQQNCQYYTVVIGEQLLANTSPRDTRITAARSIHVYHSAYHRCQHPGTSSFIHSRLPNSSVACYSALIECMDRERSFWMVQRLRMLSYMTDAVTELFKVQDHIPWHMALPTARWASWVRKQWTESSAPPPLMLQLLKHGHIKLLQPGCWRNTTNGLTTHQSDKIQRRYQRLSRHTSFWRKCRFIGLQTQCLRLFASTMNVCTRKKCTRSSSPASKFQ